MEKKYYDGCITREDGSIIKLKTAEDLYNLILEDNNQVNFLKFFEKILEFHFEILYNNFNE